LNQGRWQTRVETYGNWYNRPAERVGREQALQALPYLLTVVLLAGFVGRSGPPRAGGQPYVKEY